MFCSSCGKNLPDGAKFCTGCGAKLGGSSSSFTSSPIIKGFLDTLKGFFSPKAVSAVGASAQSNGLEWCLLALVSMLTYAFAFALNIKAAFGEHGPDDFEFGSMFLSGFLFSFLTYFLFSACVFAGLRFIAKKNVGLFNVLNLVATASLGLACIWVLNILLGFIWIPLILITSFAGFFITVLLIYIGLQKIDHFETSPFFAYAAAVFGFVFLAVLFGDLIAGAIAETDGESFTKGVMQLISMLFYGASIM